MGDEQDSWFKPFGFDPAKFVADAAKTIENTATAVVQEAGAVVQQAGAAISGAVKTVASAAPALGLKPGALAGGSGGEPSSPSSLGGSVGRGGQNNPNDVKGIQRALGISDDGKCGPGTIKAIEDFQRSLGQAKPDGRIDPGGPTSRALAGGAKGGSAAASATAAQNLVAPGSTNAGILETAEVALIAAGEVTGVSGAARKVKAAASGALKNAEQAESIVADDPFAAVIGLGFGAVQGVAPGGFLLGSPKPESKAFELGRGVGLIGGGIAVVAVGGGAEVVGTTLDATGVGAVVGVPVNILGAAAIASGVVSAGAGIVTVGGVLATEGGGAAKGPPTEVDPPKPPEPKAPKPNIALTPEQARQNLIDAVAEQKATAKESQEALEEFIRFRQNRPGSKSGLGDPSKFDPDVLEALQDRASRAQQADEAAIVKLQAARDAAARARGGGGFPPPRR